MGNPAGQSADGFHFLCPVKLLFQFFSLGNILGNANHPPGPAIRISLYLSPGMNYPFLSIRANKPVLEVIWFVFFQCLVYGLSEHFPIARMHQLQ